MPSAHIPGDNDLTETQDLLALPASTCHSSQQSSQKGLCPFPRAGLGVDPEPLKDPQVMDTYRDPRCRRPGRRLRAFRRRPRYTARPPETAFCALAANSRASEGEGGESNKSGDQLCWRQGGRKTDLSGNSF